MLRKVLFFFSLLSPLSEFAQVADTVRSDGSLIVNIQKLNIDSAWNHSIEEADLVLKVKISSKYYMTFYGRFFFDVLQVVKGDYKQEKGNFELGLIEFSQDAFEKKYRPLLVSNLVYIGFNKINGTGSSGYFMEDTITGNRWDYLMSSPNYVGPRRTPTKRTLPPGVTRVPNLGFCPKRGLNFRSGMQSNYNKLQRDSVLRVNLIEDSIFNEREKIRCACERDSVRFVQQIKDSCPLIELKEFNKILKRWGLSPYNPESKLDDPENDLILGLGPITEDLILENVQLDDHHGWGFDDHGVWCYIGDQRSIIDSVVKKQTKPTLDDFEKDSINYIYFWVKDPFVNMPVNDSAWGFLRDKPEGIDSVNKTDALRKPDLPFFPNPASSFVTVNMSEETKIELVDVNGKIVLSCIVPSGSALLDIQELKIGYYLLMLGQKR